MSTDTVTLREINDTRGDNVPTINKPKKNGDTHAE